MTDDGLSPFKRAKKERLENLRYLKKRWQQYNDDKNAIKADAMRKASERILEERGKFAKELRGIIERPAQHVGSYTVADISEAMGVTRQTVAQIIAIEEHNNGG